MIQKKMTLRNINRIAIIKLRNIGDTLLSTPAVRHLRNTFPDAHITIFVGEGTEQMVENNTAIDEIIVVRRSLNNVSLCQKIYRVLEPYWKIFTGNYDLVLDYTTGDRASYLTALSRAKTRAAFKTIKSENSFWKSKIYTHFIELPPFPTHEVVRHLKLLEAIGISTTKLPLELNPSDESLDWAEKQIAREPNQLVIHFHPVARWLFKCWDDHFAAELIQKLVDSLHAKVVITSSLEPKEMERIDRILSIANRSTLNLTGKTSLIQTSAISKKSDLFVGVDTAPMHMAAAVGTPVVCLFGPSGVETWCPWGNRAKVLYHGCPCNQSGIKDCPHDSIRTCLKSITVDEVYQAIIDLLDETKNDRIKA